MHKVNDEAIRLVLSKKSTATDKFNLLLGTLWSFLSLSWVFNLRLRSIIWVPMALSLWMAVCGGMYLKW